MRKFISVLAAFALIAGTFTGCTENRSDGANYSFDCALPGNPESLDPQFASDSNSMTVIANLFTGLVTMNDKGEISNAAAESYTISDDMLTYTFKIRDDCYWYFDEDEDEETDENEVTPISAYDFVFAFRRIFNPETCSPHREKFRCLKNAGKIIDKNADYSEIGVRAISDRELVFELEYPSAGFLSSLSTTPAMPCNEEFFNSTKGRYGLDDRSVISNGAFFVRQWFYDPYGNDNFIYMGRNDKNGTYDKIYPSYLNFYIKRSRKEAAESFSGSTSDVLLTFDFDAGKNKDHVVRAYQNYTLGIITNPENSAYSNPDIKKALAYGIDKDNFEGQISSDLQPAYSVIPPGISFLNKSYRELISEKTVAVDEDGKPISYDPELALSYYKKGMSNMGLQSLENIKILVPEDIMDTEYLHLVTQNWQTLFGFYIGIEEVPEDEYYNRIDDGEYTMAIYPLSGSYNNPLAVLEEFETGNSSWGFSDSRVDSVIDEVRMLDNYNNGLELIAEGEKAILNNFEFIPVFYKTEYEVMGQGNDDILYDPFTKQLYFRHAKYYE
ncbi:MAG: peptide ABC transporter substrate-binding protein [Oscillospiraceae bacterium]|nr:peptide ABC transporter substrate-binding protein [Oscillospiraceae bacterium]